MRWTARLLAVLGAALMLGAVVSSASAGRLSTSEGFRIVWSPMTLTLEPVGSVRCKVTLEGSFASRTIRKVARALLARGFFGALTACTGGRATLLTETLPWHYTYLSFSGILPRIDGWELLHSKFPIRVEVGGVTCLGTYTTESEGSIRMAVEAGGVMTSATIGEVPMTVMGEGLCAFTSLRPSGTGAITRPNSAARPDLHLI
jgi:hypothetical protein